LGLSVNRNLVRSVRSGSGVRSARSVRSSDLEPHLSWPGCPAYHAAMDDTWTIGEIAKRSGVAVSALRYYEERGLIHSERSSSGHRRFPRAVLRRIAFIVFAQRVGLTLDEIGVELARLPAGRIPTDHDWSQLSRAWVVRLDARIADLERLKRGLTECIGCGCLSIAKCRLANPADRAREHGPGARFLREQPPV
jgi:MerR family transcriptional regulator, redox-sensitive transcriptional activator SoxR